ncbi:hypothetical protein NUM_72700 [Actinocatenispora comari]|uniref:Uncharacterized protein n=1 Tax=Actinocatenispora comari TaxID=2807577 RepID=A0A8J4EPT4_9ACTN|nr:hypothetical protein NUM_72700 [Actinocatenispora comari]
MPPRIHLAQAEVAVALGRMQVEHDLTDVEMLRRSPSGRRQAAGDAVQSAYRSETRTQLVEGDVLLELSIVTSSHPFTS